MRQKGVLVDSDIFFKLVHINRSDIFVSIRQELKWNLYISRDVYSEIKDEKSIKVRDFLLRSRLLKIYDAPSLDLDREICLKYEQLRKKMARVRLLAML